MLLKIQKSADVKYEIDKYFDILYVRVCSSFSRLHTSYIHTQNKNSTRLESLKFHFRLTSSSLPVMFLEKMIIFKFLMALLKMVMKLDLENFHI